MNPQRNDHKKPTSNTRLETTNEQRGDHGEGRRLDRLDKGDTGQLVHDFGYFLGVGDGANNVTSHVFDITVSNDITGSQESFFSALGHLLLHINDGL